MLEPESRNYLRLRAFFASLAFGATRCTGLAWAIRRITTSNGIAYSVYSERSSGFVCFVGVAMV